MTTYSQWSKPEAVFHVRLRCGSLSIKTPVSFLANEFDVGSVLHGEAVNQICVIHGAMNGLQKSKDLFKDCFENVNIPIYLGEKQ